MLMMLTDVCCISDVAVGPVYIVTFHTHLQQVLSVL